MLRWKRRVQGYTPEGSREFQVRIWGARGEGVKAGSESSDTASSIGTLSEAVSMWWKKVISLSNNEEGGENKIFQLFFFFSVVFYLFVFYLTMKWFPFIVDPHIQTWVEIDGVGIDTYTMVCKSLEILSPWVSQPVSRYTLLSGWRTRGWPVEEAKVKGWVASLGQKMAIS